MSKILSSSSVHYSPTALPENGLYRYTYHSLGNSVELTSPVRWVEGEDMNLVIDGNQISVEPTLSGLPPQSTLMLVSTSIPFSSENTLVVDCSNPDVEIISFGTAQKDGNTVATVGAVVPLYLKKVILDGYLVTREGKSDLPYSRWTLYNLYQ